MCFTVVLAVTANGMKCPPMAIFKRKTVPKNIPEGFFLYLFIPSFSTFKVLF